MKFKGLFAAVLIAVSTLALPTALMVAGCARNQQPHRQTINTIASLGYTVDTAFKGYLDLVVAGKVATNGVLSVSKSYSLFQAAYNSALTISALNTNAPPSVDLQNAASQALLTIEAAKGK